MIETSGIEILEVGTWDAAAGSELSIGFSLL
jgi:hypothetical protein